MRRCLRVWWKAQYGTANRPFGHGARRMRGCFTAWARDAAFRSSSRRLLGRHLARRARAVAAAALARWQLAASRRRLVARALVRAADRADAARLRRALDAWRGCEAFAREGRAARSRAADSLRRRFALRREAPACLQEWARLTAQQRTERLLALRAVWQLQRSALRRNLALWRLCSAGRRWRVERASAMAARRRRLLLSEGLAAFVTAINQKRSNAFTAVVRSSSWLGKRLRRQAAFPPV